MKFLLFDSLLTRWPWNVCSVTASINGGVDDHVLLYAMKFLQSFDSGEVTSSMQYELKHEGCPDVRRFNIKRKDLEYRSSATSFQHEPSDTHASEIEHVQSHV